LCIQLPIHKTKTLFLVYFWYCHTQVNLHCAHPQTPMCVCTWRNPKP
jgi:hypothetical protein